MFIDIQKIAGGQPLPEGQVFIGLIGTDPVDSPVSVYSDYECTVSISTPLTLDDNGLPIDSSGNQVNLYANFDFSIQLQDKYGTDFYLNYVNVQALEQAGIVRSILSGNGINVNSLDPENPTISNTGILSISSTSPVSIDNTDAQNPVISADIKTIVIPSGQSFRIVDSISNPSFVFAVDNEFYSANIQRFGLQFTDGKIQSKVEKVVGSQQITQTFYAQNDNGFVSHIIGLAADGTTSLDCDAERVTFINIPTYADNASAILGGLQVGNEYYTPSGARYKVI